MKLTIGLCDDCAEQIELLKKYIEGDPIGMDFEVFSSTEPEFFLTEVCKNKPQLLFLDIDMKGMGGIELGERIRRIQEDAVIIYITAYEEFALEAFRVRAFHYLIKPLNRAVFHQVFQEALGHILRRSGKEPQKTFALQNKGEVIMINYQDIFYFEKVGHKIKIHTADRDVFYYGNLYQVLRELDESKFVQCHQGYIVNLDKIRSFRDRCLYIEGNLKLPVSRTFAEKIRESLAVRLFSGRD